MQKAGGTAEHREKTGQWWHGGTGGGPAGHELRRRPVSFMSRTSGWTSDGSRAPLHGQRCLSPAKATSKRGWMGR